MHGLLRTVEFDIGTEMLSPPENGRNSTLEVVKQNPPGE